MITKQLDKESLKQLCGKYVFQYIKQDMVVGVGTGSTVKYFIEQLAKNPSFIQGAVSSSEATTRLLKQYHIPVYDLNNVDKVDIYIDGADEVNQYLQMIKGGGAALTREKILSAASDKFICIVDESKYVARLGTFPVPIEVIPMSRSYVARQIAALGGNPDWRMNTTTDNGNWILDIHNLNMEQPSTLEQQLNSIAGVVSNGIFAIRPANELVIAKFDGTIEIIPY